MAKRGLVNPETHKTEEWNGDDLYYARMAVENYERKAQEDAAERPRRFMATLVRRLKPRPKPH